MAGEDVFVVGGANSAGQAALHLARYAARVRLLVRGDSLAGMSAYLITQLTATPNVEVKLRTQIAGAPRRDPPGGPHAGGHGAEEARAAPGRGGLHHDRCRTLYRMAPQPHPGRARVRPDHRDLPRRAWPLKRAPLPFETSLPGVFAVGDVRHGSIKRVAGAVGKGRSRWARFTSTWPSWAVEMRRGGTPKRNRLRLGRQVAQVIREYRKAPMAGVQFRCRFRNLRGSAAGLSHG